MVFEAQTCPLYAHLTGGMELVQDLADVTAQARAELNATAQSRKRVTEDAKADQMVEAAGSMQTAQEAAQSKLVRPRPFPATVAQPSQTRRKLLEHLRGMVD